MESELIVLTAALFAVVAIVASFAGYRVGRTRAAPQPEEQHPETGHNAKLEALGGLAAGIAHEINTPVQFVGDNAHFLRDVLRDVGAAMARYRELIDATEEGRAARAEIDEELDIDYLIENGAPATERVIEGIDRVASIVRAMKDFAHPDGAEKAAVDLNRTVETTLTVARNEYKYIADLKMELGELPTVTCHQGEIAQVILNLVVNAAHAMAEQGSGENGTRGELTVRTFTEGDVACVTIADNGSGIPEAVRARIFEPFFTTKPAGRGSGQGLAISRAIVEKGHGGKLSFETELGRGTTFFIRLPVERNVEAPMEAAA